MKSNLLKNVLEWFIATGVVLSIIFFFQFYNYTKDLRNLQMQVGAVQQTQQFVAALLRDTAEYNRRNPDANLTRILESVGVTQAAGAAATTPTTNRPAK